MSLERQFLDHILSPRLAHQPVDSAVGQPLIGATWVDEYPRVCVSDTQEQGDGLTRGDRGHPRLVWATPHTHPHTCIYTHARPSWPPCPFPLPFGIHHVPDTGSAVAIRVSGAALFTQMLEAHLCARLHAPRLPV